VDVKAFLVFTSTFLLRDNVPRGMGQICENARQVDTLRRASGAEIKKLRGTDE